MDCQPRPRLTGAGSPVRDSSRHPSPSASCLPPPSPPAPPPPGCRLPVRHWHSTRFPSPAWEVGEPLRRPGPDPARGSRASAGPCRRSDRARWGGNLRRPGAPGTRCPGAAIQLAGRIRSPPAPAPATVRTRVEARTEPPPLHPPTCWGAGAGGAAACGGQRSREAVGKRPSAAAREPRPVTAGHDGHARIGRRQRRAERERERWKERGREGGGEEGEREGGSEEREGGCTTHGQEPRGAALSRTAAERGACAGGRGGRARGAVRLCRQRRQGRGEGKLGAGWDGGGVG